MESRLRIQNLLENIPAFQEAQTSNDGAAAATHEQVEAASKLVPDDIVQMICAAGTPDEVREKVAQYMADGCTCPILYPLGPDVKMMIDTFAGWTP